MFNFLKTAIILPLISLISGVFGLQPDIGHVQPEIRITAPLIEELPLNADTPPPEATSTASEQISERGGEDFNCSCVSFFRSKAPELSKTIPRSATAAEISATQEFPEEGGAVLWKATELSPLGHISFIEEILPDGRLRISEHNFRPCETSERIVSPDNPLIKGFR